MSAAEETGSLPSKVSSKFSPKTFIAQSCKQTVMEAVMSCSKPFTALFFLAFLGFSCRPSQPLSLSQSAKGDKYGVMTGQLLSHSLEAEAGEGRWPHYVLELQTESGPARAVINFKSRYVQVLQF